MTWRIWIITLSLLISGCGGSGEPAAPVGTAQRGDLVSITSATTIGVTDVNAYILTLAALGVDTGALNGTTYAVSLHRIVYKTLAPDGRLIDASGVVAYPVKTAGASSPLLSFQHGTIFSDADAPSSGTNSDAALMALAGSGFIVAMPDYIGYVASTAEIHTYVHARGLAASIVDMLRATRQLLASNHVATNGQLFLTGYSEGGYATLAAQKEMEQNLPVEFPITASLPAAGPYDMLGTALYMVGLATNPNPEFVGFVFKAYDHWHGWNRLNDIFQSPYNTVVATYYDGSQNGGAIHAALTTDSSALFATTFRSDFLGGGETAIRADFAGNDIYNWAPVTPTRLFHGEDDDVVPYFNASNAASAMAAAGSTAVTLVNCTTPLPIIPRGHTECVWDYLGQMFGWFVPLASNL
jgi:pimeloyl-ACP methyl ester carboxylesterase